MLSYYAPLDLKAGSDNSHHPDFDIFIAVSLFNFMLSTLPLPPWLPLPITATDSISKADTDTYTDTES